MAFVLADRVKETSITTGTGTLALAGAETDFQSFLDGIGVGNSCYYTIELIGEDEWEVGIGTVGASPNTLSRDVVFSSSNGGALVDFSAGSKEVYVVHPAASTLYQDNNGVARIGGTNDYLEVKADGEIELVGTARVIKDIVLNNADLGKGNTAPDQVIVGNFTAWEFHINDDAVITFKVPSDWEIGTDMSVDLHWYIDEVYSSDKEVQWRVDWSALTHNEPEEIDNPNHTGQIDSGSINIPAVANRLVETTIGVIAGSSLQFDDELGFKLSRIDVAGDNPVNHPNVLHLQLKYTSNKLGFPT